jgi:hypothetical protein
VRLLSPELAPLLPANPTVAILHALFGSAKPNLVAQHLIR